jgi:phosphoribosylformylglycinamidine synthase
MMEDAMARAKANGIEAEPIGRTIANRIIFESESGDHCVTLADLRTAHEAFFPKLMGADAALA